MDNGASSYRRFLDGDDKGLEEIVRDYKDGLILYLNGFVNNFFTAEELKEKVELDIANYREDGAQKAYEAACDAYSELFDHL